MNSPMILWDSLPTAPCLKIFSLLPIKSRARLASTCRKFHDLYVTFFKEPEQEQIWSFLGNGLPLPESLVHRVTVLTVPGLEMDDEALGDGSSFLATQIIRMKNLRRIILEENPLTKKCVLLEKDIHSLMSCQSLEILQAPRGFLTFNRCGENLRASALECGNLRLAKSILSQLELYALLSPLNSQRFISFFDRIIDESFSYEENVPRILEKFSSVITSLEQEETVDEIEKMAMLMSLLPQPKTLAQLTEDYFSRLHQDRYISLYVAFFQDIFRRHPAFWSALSVQDSVDIMAGIYFHHAFRKIKETEEYNSVFHSIIEVFMRINGAIKWRDWIEIEIFETSIGSFQLMNSSFIQRVLSKALKAEGSKGEWDWTCKPNELKVKLLKDLSGYISTIAYIPSKDCSAIKRIAILRGVEAFL